MNEENKWICPSCGSRDNNGNFCETCGTPRPASAPATPKEPQTTGNDYYRPPQGSSAKTVNYSSKDKKKANFWSIISLLLSYALPIVAYLFLIIMVAMGLSDEIILLWAILAFIVSALGLLFGFAIMIVIRIHHPKCVLGKVVMWIDIGFSALLLIGLGIFAIQCLWAIKDY